MKPTNARVHDLIAKTARVTIKDTLRVVLSMQVIANHLGCTMEEIAALPFDPNRATPEQSEACTEEFRLMCKQLNEAGHGDEIKRLRQID